MSVSLWHWTKRENVNSILREGLKPCKKDWCVYLSPKPTGWMNLKQGKKRGEVLLQVDFPTKTIEVGYVPECEHWELLYFDTIPPEYISIYKGKGDEKKDEILVLRKT